MHRIPKSVTIVSNILNKKYTQVENTNIVHTNVQKPDYGKQEIKTGNTNVKNGRLKIPKYVA